MTSQTKSSDSLIIKTRLLWRRLGMSRKLAIALVAMAVASGLATVATMTGWQDTPDPDPQIVLALLYTDAVLLLLLGVVVARRLVSIWAERRRGQAGSGLHTRLVLMFGLVAAAPAILVAIFSVVFLNFGIQTWFSDKIKTALEASHAVGISYLHEHQQNIRADVLATANDLNNEAAALMRNRRQFNNYLTRQAEIRGFQEALVIDGNGRILARSMFSQSLEFDLMPKEAMNQASRGRIVVLNIKEDRVRAIVKLDGFVDAYFLAGRFVDPQVLEYIENTAGAVDKYKSLEKNQEGIQITFVMIFGVVALLLLMVAVWVGLTLAGKMSRPISRLISASERVSDGELGARVEETAGTDEISSLGRAFNKMTSQLQTQQRGLIEANRQLDERMRFTETVLSGVSAGVIGLDNEGRIHLPNRIASELLGYKLENVIGQPLATVIPEFNELLEKSIKRPDRLFSDEIKIEREGHVITLLVNIAGEKLGDETLGYVVTFDDVTELLSAQRKAAWADVARRIAHEIKNPLTPIQLSAERLQRKYLKQIDTDPETFSSCTETIIRQVEEIGRMVDEFSSFARMPQATLREENLSDICRQAVSLERHRHPEIDYQLEVPEGPVSLRCDSSQIGQALTNLLKNAAESVSSRFNCDTRDGEIRCSIAEITHNKDDETLAVIINDNGMGLPKSERQKLTEPYVTSREGGTGLGLAIVKKIMEDHSGEILLADSKDGGAMITLLFHQSEEAEDENDVDPMKSATGVMTNVS
ncbi:MAG: PAS domain-containing sensor histidine kinase [Rhodospirillaceae bacterium]|jgi:two-component system, NtrC family, nitrogen regulation sensor histidine kinase NtrY|nr:PAS domain-containing sensor histidine kinase [Rhodospirillaceae bacterium]MBT5245023.1 PAS domain-containing sensor histidine kinase [Rhodospirillaceae bacterium]MBT5561091.1 PAS domain-containing sensor histidine kinase [Rhodospirillaceae bacterium]MBT6241024.1 PAS domain-containing sensor histidine kinase [Rhodospirillaceae bacterium]